MLKKLAFFSLLISLVSQTSWADLTFGVVPQQSASKLAKLWVPILTTVGNEVGEKILFKTAPNIPEFEKRLARGDYDLAYMNPYHYTVFHQNPGYIAFANQKDKKIRGIVVTRKDSALQSLKDLADANLAFPAPAAFAASVLPRAELTAQKIRFTPKYVLSHDSVYRTVAKGLYPAGGGIQRTFNNVAPQIRTQLRVLWTTTPFTPHAFAAHPRVDEAKRKRIADAFLNLNHNKNGQKLLKKINFKGIQSAQDQDWDDVRALGLKMLEALIKG